MLIYFGLYFILISSAILLFDDKENLPLLKCNKMPKILICLVYFLFIFIILGLRHPVMGIDLHYGEDYGYLGSFKDIASLSWGKIFSIDYQNYEKGYVVFNKLLSYISTDYQMLIITYSLIFSICSAILVYQSEDFLFGSIIFMGLPSFLIAFSGIRQTIALSLIMIAYICVKKRQFAWFVLLVLLASTFHSSAIVCLILYPLYFIKRTPLIDMLSFLSIAFVHFFRVPLFKLATKILNKDIPIENNGSRMLFYVFILILLFIYLFGSQKDETIGGLKNIFLVACLCQAFGDVYSIALRLGYYFMISITILLPKMFTTKSDGSELISVNSRLTRIMALTIFVLFALYGLYILSTGDINTWYQTYPYRFFWE